MSGKLVESLRSHDGLARTLVSDLHAPAPRVFWLDLLITLAIAWPALLIAGRPDVQLLPTLILGSAASLAFYRALCFIHELTHVLPASLPHFETFWNWFVGVPLLMPSFIYTGVHNDHHKASTYGTANDPEYMPFAASRPMIVSFVLHSVLIPAALMFRFLVLSIPALLVPRFQKFLIVHASSLCMNVKYRRTVTPKLTRKVQTWQMAILVVWGGAAALAFAGVLSWKVFAVWYGATAFASVVNVLRTLGAHRYESTGDIIERFAQLEDSIDTPGAWWTELWAPVGLRYHALHHYFPGIPYHNLPKAYRRLTSNQTSWSVLTSPSLGRSLHQLISTAGREQPVERNRGMASASRSR